MQRKRQAAHLTPITPSEFAIAARSGYSRHREVRPAHPIEASQPRTTRMPAVAAGAILAFMIALTTGPVHAGPSSPQIIRVVLIKAKIIAITHPKLVPAEDAAFLKPQDRVLGVVVGGTAKAYPLRVLAWHEVVNDVTEGKPLAVTYCPLTFDAAVYERTVGGQTVTLSPANKLYESTTVFTDSATRSLWSQFDGTAIAGVAKGRHLTELASIVTPWFMWKSYHPHTLVMSTDTGFARNYHVDPYKRYEGHDGMKFPVSNNDQRLRRDEMVLGVDVDHHSQAFPFSRMAVAKMPVTVRLGGKNVMVVFDRASATAGAADERGHIPAYTGLWFGWATFHPHSEIWGREPSRPATPLSVIFKEGGDLSHAREGQSATLLKNGKVLIAGGDSGRAMLPAAELYDPAKHAFAVTGEMKKPRGGHRATLLADGQVLFTGGIDDLGPIPAAEVYDPATAQFTLVQPMHQKRQKHTATLLENGQVLIAGGFNGDQYPTPNTELYDPAKGVFAQAQPMLSARRDHTATLLSDGRVLLTGGTGGKGEFLNSAEIYDPSAGSFVATGNMSTARQGHTATLLKNGQVLITGGSTENIPALASAELYDPATGHFTTGGDMVVARQGHQAVLLSDGDVLIVGGAGIDAKNRYLASAELYDSTTKHFTVLGEMLLPRFGPTLTLLDSGEVLVTGRYASPAYFATATAELYRPPTKAKQ